MPSTYYDADVSGSGSAAFVAGATVIFVSVDITTIPPLARSIDDTDKFLRAGWFSLGDSFNIGLGTFDYWRPVVYFDFEHMLWTPVPGGDLSLNTFSLPSASRVRWFVSPGGVAHLHVFGN